MGYNHQNMMQAMMMMRRTIYARLAYTPYLTR